MVAIIYKQAAAMTQSAPFKEVWFLELERENHSGIEPVMGWISSNNTKVSQVKLKFDTRQQAVNYAKRCNISYRVISRGNDERGRQVIKSYLDNFK